jgi:hypothetical protein
LGAEKRSNHHMYGDRRTVVMLEYEVGLVEEQKWKW